MDDRVTCYRGGGNTKPPPLSHSYGETLISYIVVLKSGFFFWFYCLGFALTPVWLPLTARSREPALAYYRWRLVVFGLKFYLTSEPHTRGVGQVHVGILGDADHMNAVVRDVRDVGTSAASANSERRLERLVYLEVHLLGS